MVHEDDSVLYFYCATAVQNRMLVTGQPVLLNWVQQKVIAKFNKTCIWTVDQYATTIQFIWQQYDLLKYQQISVYCFA